MSAPQFTQSFGLYVCVDDTIETVIDGIVYVARIDHDYTGDRPDERDDGFWPSLDPEAAGYIGKRSKSTLARHKAHAEDIMRAWRNDEWFYCGVVITAYLEDEDGERIELPGMKASLWGIECNYPAPLDKRRKSVPNAYLTEAASELLGEAIEYAVAAKAKLHRVSA